MKFGKSLLVVFFVATATAAVLAQQQGLNPTAGQHVMISPADVKWSPAPPTMPKGAEVAVLAGDPAQAGPFTMRLKVPANYKVAPHWHPAVEHLTVISGKFNLGMGEKFDQSKTMALAPGTFAVMPAKTPHFVWTDQETIVQLHGTGPWGMTYVNPADDPSKQKP